MPLFDRAFRSQPPAVHQRTPLALAVLGLALSAAVLPPAARAQSEVAQALPLSHARKTFSLPAGPLDAALDRFARTAGVNLVYDEALVAGRATQGLTGSHGVAEGLGMLLSGSGLEAVAQPGGGFSLRRAARAPEAGGAAAAPGSATLPTVTITASAEQAPHELPPAYAGGQVARGGRVGMLGNKDVMDTPFSITSYTNQTIQDQQARTIQDVVANDPSIVTGSSQNGSTNGYESLTIRGFRDSSTNASGSLNGLAGMAPLSMAELDYVERVEIFRGPSALLNGMSASGVGGIGGTINLVTKQAGDNPLTELTTRYDSRSMFGAHADVGRRFGDQKQFGVRFNGAFRKGDTPIESQAQEIGSAGLSLDYRGERVRLSADFAYQSIEADPDSVQVLSFASLGVIPKAPDAKNSLNAPWGQGSTKTTMGMLRGEFYITDNLTGYAAFGKQGFDRRRRGLSVADLVDANSGTIRYASVLGTGYERDVTSGQTGLRALAKIGSVDHALAFNVSQTTTTVASLTRFTQLSPSYTTNLYAPTFGSELSMPDDSDLPKTGETKTSSIGISDTMSMLDEQIQFTAGVRRQQVEAENFNATTGATTSSYKSHAWSPALGLVIKPSKNVSIYANYIQGLQQGTTVSSTYANAGEIFPPYVSKQYETGVKVDFGVMTTTLAVFQIAQPSTTTITNSDGSRTLALNGEQRNRGIELNTYGEAARGVRLLGGVTLLDAELTKTVNGQYDGNRAAGAPKVRTVIGGEWDLPFAQGLTLTGRVNYTGNQVVSNTNENLKISSYTTLDLGGRYSIQSPWSPEPIAIRLNVDNVFNKSYWAGTNGASLIYLSAPRTVRLSATFRF